ncbi:MAG TPA: HAD hydrolase-like protein, partial [Promineifilum sp.]|nr:HAD hydrolase-like protein [Promineifilum sp.]
DRLLAPYDPPPDLEDIIHATEMANLPYFGFGVNSFTLSLIETAVRVTGGRVGGQDIGRLIDVAKGMIAADIRLIDEVEDTLAALSADYSLLLITKGDLLHQQDKVARSGLGRYFSGVEVVSDKTAATYADILRRRGVAPARFLMIGNSLRSDIVPVAELGGQAVYVPIENTWVYDHVPVPAGLPGAVHQVARLGEVVALVRQLAGAA